MIRYTGWSSGEELYHYGIPGQKHGIRRYQNPDGSLTPEGMARYGRKARGREFAAKIYDVNAKFYKKMGNRALASMNAAAANRERKIAEEYRKGNVTTNRTSATTQRVLSDYRNMSNKEFFSKYKTTRRSYANRVKKWGDPHLYRTTGKLATADIHDANVAQLYAKGKNSKRY